MEGKMKQLLKQEWSLRVQSFSLPPAAQPVVNASRMALDSLREKAYADADTTIIDENKEGLDLDEEESDNKEEREDTVMEGNQEEAAYEFYPRSAKISQFKIIFPYSSRVISPVKQGYI